ncbi:MAG: hypothetical protein KatS3mg100_382 [Candidatus Parcubacteria bacterium]|nr:MAG: hypothetical protein KatS3mg100_382 [Candidatus Parcubacteria bacterium]
MIAQDHSSPITRKHILLLEDDDILADLITEVLERNGYLVTRCRDGEDGLAFLKVENADLILLDIQMPKVNGYQVIEALKDARRNIPVIVISNSGQPVELQRLARVGVVDYLIKAEFDPQELLAMINTFFDTKPSATVAFPEPRQPQEDKSDAGAASGKTFTSTKRPVVLLVEDDAFLADIIMQKLRQYSYELHLARTGEEAVREYEQLRPDLILLDLLLPGMSGVDVLRHIRNERSDTQTRVIVVSNFSEDGYRDAVEQLGASRYLVKASVSPGEIAKAVEEELRTQGKIPS